MLPNVFKYFRATHTTGIAHADKLCRTKKNQYSEIK